MRLPHLGYVDNFRGPDSGPLPNGNEDPAVYISESGLYLRGSPTNLTGLPRIRRGSGDNLSPLPRVRRVSYKEVQAICRDLANARPFE